MSASPATQLAGFIAKFTPEMATRIRAVRARMRRRLPHAHELVYDNYNFFVIGYGPTERPSEAVFSLAAQASGVALCFLWGAKLPDPDKLLRGSGNQVRSIKLPDAATLDQPAVKALLVAAISAAPVPFDPTLRPRLIIKSISAKQRPRRAVTPASAQSKTKNRKSKI
jgi:hypothetical protein